MTVDLQSFDQESCVAPTAVRAPLYRDEFTDEDHFVFGSVNTVRGSVAKVGFDVPGADDEC